MKANKNKNSRGKWGLRALLACAASVAMIMSACVRDNLTEGIVKDSSGRSHATLSVDLITPSADEKTRSALDAGQLKIETVWVGVFDTNTGNMVGYFVDRPLKEDSTHVTIRDNSGSWTIPGIDIYYYDSNPEVYIVGVANFEGVEARLVGDAEKSDLPTLLGLSIDEEGGLSVAKYITWDDFRAISVDTNSIKTAAEKIHKNEPDNYPLVMGFFTADNSRHVTVDRDGNANAAKIQLTEDGQQFGAVIQPQGRIYLRRLVSDITVNIGFSTPPVVSSSGPYQDMAIQEVRSIRYKVINKPVEMYLAEHAVDQSGGTLTGKSNYLSRTANSADWLDEGYESDEDWSEPIEGSIADGYSFTYSHYENKHWGVDYDLDGVEFGYTPDGSSLSNFGYYDSTQNRYIQIDTEGKTWKEYFDELFLHNYSSVSYLSNLIHATASHRLREAKVSTDDEEPVFRALCGEASFNNNASYFLIEADMTWKVPYDGSVIKGKFYYTVHEGYTSHADGTAVNEPSRASSKSDIYDALCDFQTVRNTKYTYNLTFSGINSLILQVVRDLNGDNTMHDDGLGGEAWYSGGLMDIDPEGLGEPYRQDYDTNNWIYRFRYNGNPSEFVLWGLESMEYRNLMTWRIHNTTPDGEFNAGTFSGDDNQFEWPAIAGTTYTLEELLALDDDDPTKQFYNSFKIHVGRAYNPNQGTVDSNFGVYNGYSYFDSLLDMTIEEFLAGADSEIVRLYDDRLYWFVTCDAFETGDDNPNNFNKYQREIYLIQSIVDEDGCAYSGVAGYRQKPKNIGVEMYNFGPLYYLQYPYQPQNIDPKYSAYSAVQNFDEIGFIRWYAGVAYYFNENEPEEFREPLGYGDGWKTVWSNYHSGDYDAHEPDYYMLRIADREPVKIEWNSEYRGNEADLEIKMRGYVNNNWFSYPFDLSEFEPGDYTVTITPHYDTEFVQPVEPVETLLHIAERPFWNFDGDTYPQVGYLPYNYSYNYNSLTAWGIGDSGPNSFLTIDNQDGGHLNFGASGSPNRGSIQFFIHKHGSIRVKVKNNNNQDRRLGFYGYDFDYNDSPYVYSEYVSRDGEKYDIWFNTHQVIDGFENGPAVISIFAERRLDIYEVEWTEDENQDPSLNSSYLYYTSYPYFSDRDDYAYDGRYIHPEYTSNVFHITPGLVNYFGFYDSNPRAETYVMEVFSGSDTTPLVTEEIDADTYFVGYNGGGYGYFVYPFYVPTGTFELAPDYYSSPYYITLTPKATGYVDADRTEVCSMYVCGDDEVNWWNKNYAHVDGPANLFSLGFSQNAGSWMEYHGLVLHYGTASMQIENNYIYFGGNGYPLAAKSTPEFGRYLSFTTDRPGEVVLTASSTSNDLYRYFRLYRVNKDSGQPEWVDRSLIGQGQAPFTLSTGPVDGLTEFIICPEGGVNLYSAKFIPTADDHRESLNTSILEYSNWSTDPNHPIHPQWYEDEEPVEEGDDDYGYKYKSFYMQDHFASPFSFSDSNPRASKYELQFYDEYTFTNAKLDRQPDKTIVISADEYVTYVGGDGSKVITYPLLFDDLVSEYYSSYFLAFVKPVGDESQYKNATPQFITMVNMENWDNVRNTKPPVPVYPPTEDGEEHEWSESTKKYYELTEAMLKSNFTFWDTKWHGFEYDDYYDYDGHFISGFSQDDHVEYWGLTLNGELKYITQENVLDGYYHYYYDEDDERWEERYVDLVWLSFPASTTSDVNGSMSFVSNVGGKIIIWEAAVDENVEGKFELYRKDGNSYTKVDESVIQFTKDAKTGIKYPYDYEFDPDLGPIYPDDYEMPDRFIPVVLDTGSGISANTEFVIVSNVADCYLLCEDDGSSVDFMFLKEGTPAYEWDWKTEGFPIPNEDDMKKPSPVTVSGYSTASKIVKEQRIMQIRKEFTKMFAPQREDGAKKRSLRK